MKSVNLTCGVLLSGVLAALGQSAPCEIRSAPGGAVAELGGLKVEFPNDVVDPIDITLPDGKPLSCQAQAVVWYNPATDQAVRLGTLTNSTGVIIPPSEVIYSNAFQTGVHLKYRIESTGSLSQYVLFDEKPELPVGADWSESNNPALEVWSRWAGTAPVSVESRVIALRDTGVGGEPVDATDQTISFGTATLVGDGKAFNLSNPDDTVAVAKAWRPADDGSAVLIESVDWKSLAARLASLPGASRPKSAGIGSAKRSALLASLSRGPTLGAGGGSLSKSASRAGTMLVAAGGTARPRQQGVIDFTLVWAVPGAPEGTNALAAGTSAANGAGSSVRGTVAEGAKGSKSQPYQALTGLSSQNGLQVFTPLK